MKPQTGRSREISREIDEIDDILGRRDEVLPSSGFALSVMDAVRREAAAPTPIPFPWRRAIPGMVVGGLVLLAILVWVILAVGQMDTSAVPQPPVSSLPPLTSGSLGSAVTWILLSLAGAYVTVKLSMRMASGPA